MRPNTDASGVFHYSLPYTDPGTAPVESMCAAHTHTHSSLSASRIKMAVRSPKNEMGRRSITAPPRPRRDLINNNNNHHILTALCRSGRFKVSSAGGIPVTDSFGGDSSAPISEGSLRAADEGRAICHRLSARRMAPSDATPHHAHMVSIESLPLVDDRQPLPCDDRRSPSPVCGALQVSAALRRGGLN